MADYYHKSYMLDCATRLKDLGNTENKPNFFRYSSLGHLDEMLSLLGKIADTALGIPDNQNGSIGNNHDAAIDTPMYDFCIVKHVGVEDHDEREIAKAECKAIGFKILARMDRDKRLGANGLLHLSFSNIPYQTIGPIGDNYFGVLFSVQVSDAAPIIYNANDWT